MIRLGDWRVNTSGCWVIHLLSTAKAKSANWPDRRVAMRAAPAGPWDIVYAALNNGVDRTSYAVLHSG